MKKTLIICSMVVLAACTVKLATPMQTDADRGSKKFSGLTLDDLSQGKKLFEEKCTQCHGLKRPSKFSEDQWKKIIPGMAKRAEKNHKAEIDSKSQDLILKFLVTMGSN